jgi:tetratricopeptide (TPR) repeat protein
MAMTDLAISYEDNRRDEALELREQVLTLRRKVLGSEHPDTLRAMHGLALSYISLRRNNDALKLLEKVLPLRRKVLGPEHPDTLWAMNDLALSYGSVGRYNDAVKFLEQVLALRRKASGLKHPDTLRAMNDLAYAYGSVGRSNEVITLLEQECEVDPVNAPVLATWQTWFNQDANYEATRRRMLQQADGTDLASTADRAAKAACLQPSSDAALLAQALNLARRAVKLGKSDPWLPWYQLSLGMAEYRNGQFANAERTLTIAEQTAAERHDLEGTAGLFRAMSVFRQDRPEEAQKLFTQAAAHMPPFPEDERKPHVDGRPIDQNVLIWWLALKEAKALIQSRSAPAVEPSKPT